MPKTFESREWGTVEVHEGEYTGGNLAVQLLLPGGEPLAKLSVNLPESKNLPPRCFYGKDWSENLVISAEALRSGLFKIREDLPIAITGFVWANAWEILE